MNTKGRSSFYSFSQISPTNLNRVHYEIYIEVLNLTWTDYNKTLQKCRDRTRIPVTSKKEFILKIKNGFQ